MRYLFEQVTALYFGCVAGMSKADLSHLRPHLWYRRLSSRIYVGHGQHHKGKGPISLQSEGFKRRPVDW